MERFLAWLTEEETSLQQEAEQLRLDGRVDDGNLTKVRANVYGICKSVLRVLDAEKGALKLAELHTTWDASRVLAREHGDESKAVIEDIKLQTLDEIQKRMKEDSVA